MTTTLRLQNTLRLLAQHLHIHPPTLKLRFVKAEPKTYGWAKNNTISITIWSSASWPHLAETLAHEITHLALDHMPRHHSSSPHGPLFWATFTSLARDMGWVSPRTTIAQDGVLSLILSLSPTEGGESTNPA